MVACLSTYNEDHTQPAHNPRARGERRGGGTGGEQGGSAVRGREHGTGVGSDPGPALIGGGRAPAWGGGTWAARPGTAADP